MDKTKKNDDNAISPIVKWKILILFMAGLGVIFLFAALAQERHTLPEKIKNVADLYTVSVPGEMNLLSFNDTAILFKGTYKNPEIFMIIDPEPEYNGEFLSVDANRAKIISQTDEALQIFDINAKDLQIKNISNFEFSMLPALEYNLSFGNYVGTGYFFYAQKYSFTCIVCRRKDVETLPSGLLKLGCLKLNAKYRNSIIKRPVINSETISLNDQVAIKANYELIAARCFYAERLTQRENLLRAIRSYQKAFQFFSEKDMSNVISKEDKEKFFICLSEREKIFTDLRSEIQRQFDMKNDSQAVKLLHTMKQEAVLESETEWREWAQRQLEILSPAKR
jgi:hypothetical protein